MFICLIDSDIFLSSVPVYAIDSDGISMLICIVFKGGGDGEWAELLMERLGRSTRDIYSRYIER
jgi:hypothetical protein